MSTESEPRNTADNAARSTHVVYRITSDFSYEETPCFCSADNSHPVSDEVWDDSVAPGGYVCATCGVPVESEPCSQHGTRVILPAADQEATDA